MPESEQSFWSQKVVGASRRRAAPGSQTVESFLAGRRVRETVAVAVAVAVERGYL